MTREEIQNKVAQIVADIADVSKDKVQPQSSFINDLNIDSLCFFEISQEIEEAFQLEIDEEDFENIKLVKDAVNYIEQSLQKK